VTFRGHDLVFLKMPDGSGMLALSDQLDERNHVCSHEFYSDPSRTCDLTVS